MHNILSIHLTRVNYILNDATSEIHAEFFKSETTVGCLKIMRDYIDKKDLFKALYVDIQQWLKFTSNDYFDDRFNGGNKFFG